MDLATIIGIALSTLLVLASIFMGGSPIMFVNVPSMLVVIGGTIGTTLVRNPLSAVLGTFGVAAKAFTTKVPAPEQLISEVLELSRTARKELLALEKAVISYPFLAKGISLCVDAVEVELIRMVLENDIRSTASPAQERPASPGGYGRGGTGLRDDWNPYRAGSDARCFGRSLVHWSGHGVGSSHDPVWRP